MKLIKPNVIPAQAITAFTRGSSASYFDSTGAMQIAPANTIRFSYNPITLAYEGALFEGSRTNRFLNSETLSTQSVSLNAGVLYTISFYGPGTISWSGGSLTGTGAFPQRVFAVFTPPTSTSYTFTVTGTVKYAQIEIGAPATSWIQTTDSVQTRSADTYGTSGVIYTNVPGIYPIWDSVSTYATTDIITYNYRNYEALMSVPAGTIPSSSPTYWLDLGPNNIFTAFDLSTSSRSYVLASPGTKTYLRYVLRTSAADAVKGISVNGILANSGGNGYPIVVSIVARQLPTSIISYSFTKTINDESDTTALLYNFATSCQLVTVEISSASGNARLELSNIVIGAVTDIGNTQYGATIGITDYSKKQADAFGNIDFIEGKFAKKLQAKTKLLNSSIPAVQNLLYSLRAVPCVWIGSDDSNFQEAMTVYGFYRDFSCDIEYPTYSVYNLDIEGLT